jgi:hypothetical protein
LALPLADLPISGAEAVLEADALLPGLESGLPALLPTLPEGLLFCKLLLAPALDAGSLLPALGAGLLPPALGAGLLAPALGAGLLVFLPSAWLGIFLFFK